MGQPKEKRENEWINRANNREGRANLRNEEKTNGLEGVKNRGANQRKKEKTNDK